MLPAAFFKPGHGGQGTGGSLGPKTFELKNYRFLVPRDYSKHKEKETQWQNESGNVIMFGVHDQLSVDFLDKMPEKQRDLKMICASAMEDFLKVLSSQP